MHITKACRNLRCNLLRRSPRIEHYCLLSYTTTEIIGLHVATYYVNILLLVTGIVSSIYTAAQDPVEKHHEEA